jgi:prepilin-type N-terminal cleavage/methylation domain
MKGRRQNGKSREDERGENRFLNRGSCAEERGFTLAEMLWVMSILLFFLAVLPLPFFSLRQQTEEKWALEQLVRDLSFAQQHALVTAKPVVFRYRTGSNGYEILEYTGSVLIKRDFPGHMRISEQGLYQFIYLANGNINRFGYLYIFVNGKERYRIFFSIGSGRFEIRGPQGKG